MKREAEVNRRLIVARQLRRPHTCFVRAYLRNVRESLHAGALVGYLSSSTRDAFSCTDTPDIRRVHRHSNTRRLPGLDRLRSSSRFSIQSDFVSIERNLDETFLLNGKRLNGKATVDEGKFTVAISV